MFAYILYIFTKKVCSNGCVNWNHHWQCNYNDTSSNWGRRCIWNCVDLFSLGNLSNIKLSGHYFIVCYLYTQTWFLIVLSAIAIGTVLRVAALLQREKINLKVSLVDPGAVTMMIISSIFSQGENLIWYFILIWSQLKFKKFSRSKHISSKVANFEIDPNVLVTSFGRLSLRL